MAMSAIGSFAKSVDLMAVYYPHWHVYPKGDEWFHPGWTEWEFVKSAKPRFPGHKQPIVPYAGYLNGADPVDVAKEIALAANAGISVFLYDYYYYDGQTTQEEALERGFLRARNRGRMKFALMWCYHERTDQFRPELGAERRILMKLAHTEEEFLGLIDLAIERYFPRREYWRKDGKLFFSIYNAPYFFRKRGGDPKRVRKELESARARVRAAGLGELHINAQGSGPEFAEQMKDCGFDSLTDYVFTDNGMPWQITTEMRRNGCWEIPYEDSFPFVRTRWDAMAKASLPYIPNVSSGWDVTPRCSQKEPYPWREREYPYTSTFVRNSPDAFQRHLAEARNWAENDPKNPGIVYVNGWNEYTEGSYLVPNNFDSDGFLRAVAAVFGRHPTNEYTYANPSTKEVLTVPAATFENIAYGAHSKQKLDVWLPADNGTNTPVIVYFHGGAWSGGAMVDAVIGPKIEKLLKRGIAVVCVGYRYLRDVERLAGIPPVAGCIDDCGAALAYVIANAREWRIDLSRLGHAGGSAGACTAMALAYRGDNEFNVKALAPIMPQTSLDPVEMREWIPNIDYGASAFGYGSFSDWLAHREDCADMIGCYSPSALARKIKTEKAPLVILRASKPVEGQLPEDSVHATAFCWRFAEICSQRGLPCDIRETGDAIAVLADALSK